MKIHQYYFIGHVFECILFTTITFHVTFSLSNNCDKWDFRPHTENLSSVSSAYMSTGQFPDCQTNDGVESILDCQRKVQTYVIISRNLSAIMHQGDVAKQNNIGYEVNQLGGVTQNPLLRSEKQTQTHGPSILFSSTLRISAKDTFLWPQVWSSCRRCSVQHGTVQLHDPDGTLQQTLGLKDSGFTLAQSKWNSFFPEKKGKILGTFIDQPFSFKNCNLVVNKPTFVVQYIDWHVGHFLVDVLEPLFHTVRRALDLNGNIHTWDRDIYLFFSVGQLVEFDFKEFDFRKILSIYDDTPFSLLRNFTIHPIYTIEALFGLSGSICFPRGLHLGLDIEQSFHAHGFDFHPSLVNLEQNEDQHIFRQYQVFQNFIFDNLQFKTSFDTLNLDKALNITYIARPKTSGRWLENEKQMLDMFWGQGHTPRIAVLERLSFSEQLQLLQSTDVLVAQSGSGVHNVLFLPGHQKPQALILLMPPGWCPWAWVYANQAVFSGLHVSIYCDEAALEGAPHSFRWFHRGWLDGDFSTKNEDQNVDLVALSNILGTVKRTLQQVAKNKDVSPNIQQVVFKKKDEVKRSIFSDIQCSQEEGGDSSSFWVHLGPSFMEFVTPGFRTFRVVVSVFTNIHPEDLFARHEGIQMCAAVVSSEWDIKTINNIYGTKWSNCWTKETFHSTSVIEYTVPANESHVLAAWLKTPTKTMIPGSLTFLPLHSDYIGSGHFKKIPRVFNFEYVYENKTFTFNLPLGEEGAVQRVLSCFCQKQDLSMQVCRDLFVAVYQHLIELYRTMLPKLEESTSKLLETQTQDAAMLGNNTNVNEDPQPSGLSPPQTVPTSKNPFYFFHLEKVGGTTLREMIALGVRRYGLAAHIPCYRPPYEGEEGYGQPYKLVNDNSTCLQFGLNPEHLPHDYRANLSVIATHGGWNEWHNLPSVQSEKNLSCLVVLRHPVSRTISYYYQRIFDTLKKHLRDLDVLEMKAVLSMYGMHFRNDTDVVITDEGMQDAACRMLSGANTYTGLSHSNFDATTVPPPKPYSVAFAKERLQKCTVGIFEKWEDTKQVLKHWFPWMEHSYQQKLQVSKHQNRETVRTLPLEIYEIILRHNQCDLQLYQYGIRLFSKQMNLIQNKRHSDID